MESADLERLKGDLEAILAVVKKCPADLQETAFRIILQKWLDDLGTPPKPIGGPPPPPPIDTPPADVPQQFQTFMRANALSGEMVGKVFHPLGPGAQLVVSDLPGKGKAGKQISLALLIAVGQAIGDGSFKCTLEDLRNLCVHYNSYDGSNFAANLTNNSTLFKSFKKGEDLELSQAGMKRAADLVKSIAAAATS